MKTPYEFYLNALKDELPAGLEAEATTPAAKAAIAIALSSSELMENVEQLLCNQENTLLPVQRLLAALTEKWPPAQGCKHSVALDENGELFVRMALSNFMGFSLGDGGRTPEETIAALEPRITATLSVLDRHATIHDDGREWMGDIELSDGQIAVGEALTGNTVFVRLGDLKLEFQRVTGAGITAPELSIAKHELYRIHPVTYQMRQARQDPPPPV